MIIDTPEALCAAFGADAIPSAVTARIPGAMRWGSTWRGPCAAHGNGTRLDFSPSDLAATVIDGRLRAYCRKGCSLPAIAAALGVAPELVVAGDASDHQAAIVLEPQPIVLEPPVNLDAEDPQPYSEDHWGRDDTPLAPTPPTPPQTPAGIVERWRTEGPLVRVATGIGPLDAACRGGLPVPWRVVIIGAPSAGKTLMAVRIARDMALGGACVGILAVDEDADDVTIRLAEMAGYSVGEAEARDPEMLDRMALDLANTGIRLYGADHTIEFAASDVSAWARAEGRHGVLVIDSIQTATSDEASRAKSPREIIEANARVVRYAADHHRLLVISTSEANRASYRSEDSAATSNDLAAGAESRAIEYGAQTVLVLRTPRDHADVIHVRVAKNRRSNVGEHWLRMDRDRQSMMEILDPTEDVTDARADREESRATAAKERAERDAAELGRLMLRHPEGLTMRRLRSAAGAAGLGGQARADAAIHVLIADGAGGVRLAAVPQLRADGTPAAYPLWRVVRVQGEEV